MTQYHSRFGRLRRLLPRRGLLLALLTSALFAAPQPAQSPAELDLANSPAALENKHVRAVHLSLQPHSVVSINRLPFESLLVSLRDASIQMTPQSGASQRWEALTGSLLWVRGNIGFSLENSGNTPANLFSLELRDSYAFDQLVIPRSDYDPVHLDPRHFRIVLENQIVRALLTHFGAREESPQTQFAQGLRINLADVYASLVSPSGEHSSASGSAGSVSWQPQGLYSIHNLNSDPLDVLYVEFRRPFCYWVGITWPHDNPELKAFILSGSEKVSRQWYKSVRREANNQEKGLVTLQFKIQKEGSIRDDDMILITAFASDAIVEAARLAIRKSAPFPPLPDSIKEPAAEVRQTFIYNLPFHPPGCPVNDPDNPAP